MKCARCAGVASSFLTERGRVRLGLRQVALNGFAKWHLSAPRPLALVLSPSVKGEATDHPRFAVHCGHCKDKQPEISMQKTRITISEPDEQGHWGKFGGRYVPETLVAPLEELTNEFTRARHDNNFWRELNLLLRDYAGRPTPLFHAQRLTAHAGGAQIYLKREDLNHTGSHKINNVLGQALLARRMGKHRVIAETGAGQHGVATATAAALLGQECTVYMGEVDMARQELNVFRMRLLGAEVRPASSGSRTLKDAVNEAMRDWVATVEHTHYCLGSVMGPHPYPWMVREFHRVIGDEARSQCNDLLGHDPDVVVACVGGGSNAIGIFSGFVDTDARLV